MDGQFVSTKINWYKIISKVILTNGLLWLGGFFNHIGIPQVIHICLTVLGGYVVANTPPNPYPTVMKQSTYIGLIVIFLIYYWGNFFEPLIKFFELNK
jgi:hypothetical protein